MDDLCSIPFLKYSSQDIIVAKKLALIGGGGHALSLLDILQPPLMVAGYVDFGISPKMPIPFLGNDSEFISPNTRDEFDILITMVSGPDCNLDTRAKVIECYSGYTSPSIIAPTAIVSSSSHIGVGAIVFHRAVVNTGSDIGCHSIINTGAIIEHECRIGNNVFIGPGAIVCGGAIIGDNTYIGAGAIIKPGAHICHSPIIGAGAVVIQDISIPGTYKGVPAK